MPSVDTPAPRLLSPRLVLLALAFWLVATAGLRPLLVPDEGRYAGVARDMLLGVGAPPLLSQGLGWVPRLNGLPFFHKPPLMYWLDMAAMAVLGIHPLSARFASLVGAWLMAAAMYFALRRWHGPAFAQRALLVLGSCPFFFIGAQYANMDMLVAGLITASVLAFVRAAEEVPAPQPAPLLRWPLLAWALTALAVLAKGLIGVVLPLLVVVPWLVAQRRWQGLRRLLQPLPLALFAALVLPWFVAVQRLYPGFFDYFIIEQQARRFANATFNNVQSPWFYLMVLPVLTLPWALWLPRAVQQWAIIARPASGAETAAARARWQLALYGWWILAVVGFFSLPSAKLVGYVLPALVPWCMLLCRGVSFPGRAAGATLVAAALCCIAAVLIPIEHTPHSSRQAAQALAAQRTPGERVVFVDSMFYDLPFYAGLREPPTVASDWADPALPRHDNWRKELADAARFDPAQGRRLLWPLTQLTALTCQAQATWFVVDPQNRTAAAAIAQVPQITAMYADANVRLLRAPGRRCP